MSQLTDRTHACVICLVCTFWQQWLKRSVVVRGVRLALAHNVGRAGSVWIVTRDCPFSICQVSRRQGSIAKLNTPPGPRLSTVVRDCPFVESDASVSSRESPCLGETRVPPGGSQTRRPDSVCRLRVHHRLLDFWRPNDEWALAALMSGRCRRGATEHVEPTSGSGKTLGRSAGL